MKSPAQGAATQALLAGSPQVAGITGEYWSDCQIAQGNPLLADEGLSRRLWETSECICERRLAAVMPSPSRGGLRRILKNSRAPPVQATRRGPPSRPPARSLQA